MWTVWEFRSVDGKQVVRSLRRSEPMDQWAAARRERRARYGLFIPVNSTRTRVILVRSEESPGMYTLDEAIERCTGFWGEQPVMLPEDEGDGYGIHSENCRFRPGEDSPYACTCGGYARGWNAASRRLWKRG